MNDDKLASERSEDLITDQQLAGILDERLDAEAVAQLVEHLDYSSRLSEKLTSAFNRVNSQDESLRRETKAVQQEVRELIMDVALLKRAVASLGQVGVMERRKIEKELVRELFPPAQIRPGTGIEASPVHTGPPNIVDCNDRLPLCKAACCRIFNMNLNPSEILADKHEWDTHQPYALQRNRMGCTYLQTNGCACTIYSQRPGACSNYSCEHDTRIWANFEDKVINPQLAQQLKALDVLYTLTPHPTGPASRDEVSPAQAASTTAAESTSRASIKQTAQPPNFDELRNLIVPKPSRRFTPPAKDSES